MRDYRGKTVVITGAGSGIGAALAAAFAAEGARLALSDIDAGGLAEAVERCRACGAEATGYALDVADRDAIYEHASRVDVDFGGADVVVNNAGVAVHGLLGDIPDDDIDWIMRINFFGVLHGTRAFLPQLAASGDGQLANVSSVFGLIGAPKDSVYNASKFAVRGLTEALRQELRIAGTPVSVSCIHPGGVRTAISRSGRIHGDDPDRVNRMFERVARTTPDQAARIIVSGLQRDRPRILVGSDAHFIAALARLLGGRYGYLAEAVARRTGV